MRSFKMMKKNIAVLILAALVAGLFPAVYADENSATRVSSLDELIQAVNTDAMGTNIELVLENGNYVVGSGAPVKIPEGKTVTIYAGESVYIRHQPNEDSAMFEVPQGSVLYLIGTGSAPIVIENTSLEELNAFLAQSGENSSEATADISEEIESGEGMESSEEIGEEGEAAAEETQSTVLSNASAVRGIINKGELHLSNISFKGFNDEADWETVRGNALVNEGTAYLKNVTVVNASGADAENSICSSGSLEIEEGDEHTKDSYVDNSGYFYSKEQRQADLNAAAEQAAAEQAAAEQAAAEQAAAEQAAAEQAAAEQAAAEQAEADAALQKVIDEAWSYASNAGIQKENTVASLEDAEIISRTPDADRSDVQEDLDETETAYKLAKSLAENTEALQLSYPDNEDLRQAATYAREAANSAEINYYSVKTIYDLLPMTEEMAMALMAAESAQTAENTGDVSNGDADSTVTSSGTSGNDSEAQSQQVVSVQEDYVEEPAAVTVTAAPATSTPAQASTYTSPASATQDTSAKQSITIYASWNDNNNANRRRPNSVRVTLKVGGSVYTNADVTASDGWTKTIENLPTGNSYSIEETSVADYATSYSVSGNTVTLSHTYTGTSTTTSNYSNGYTGSYTGTQTTTYSNNNSNTYTNTAGTTAQTSTQNTYNTQTQTATQNTTGSNTGSTKLSVTPGPSSTPVPAYTTAPAATVTVSPAPAAAGTATTASSATRSASHAWIWIAILVLAAGAIVVVLLYLIRQKQEREAAEARARARARRKAQMEAQQRISREDGDRFEMNRTSVRRSSGDIPLGSSTPHRSYDSTASRQTSAGSRTPSHSGEHYNNGAANISGRRTGRYSDGEY